MKNKTNNTKVQIDGKQNLAKDVTNTRMSLRIKMKLLTAIASVCAISISASAEEVYNFYFQKSAPQDTAISVSGAEKTVSITQSPAEPVPRVQNAESVTEIADKKNLFKRFRIGGGFALLNAPLESESYYSYYEYSGYEKSYTTQALSGLQISAKYNLNKFFGLEIGIFEGSTLADERKANMQQYGMAINAIPDSKNWELELNARNMSVSNSNIQNKLSIGILIGYKFNEQNGISLESNLMDFKGKNDRASFYQALSYVFYL